MIYPSFRVPPPQSSPGRGIWAKALQALPTTPLQAPWGRCVALGSFSPRLPATEAGPGNVTQRPLTTPAWVDRPGSAMPAPGTWGSCVQPELQGSKHQRGILVNLRGALARCLPERSRAVLLAKEDASQHCDRHGPVGLNLGLWRLDPSWPCWP